jgi:hypothetical protein
MKKYVLNSYTSKLITFLPNAHKTAPKQKIFFSTVNHNKLSFPILVSDQQGVQIVSP